MFSRSDVLLWWLRLSSKLRCSNELDEKSLLLSGFVPVCMCSLASASASSSA